jgi:putative ABC transport system permease protein
VLLTAGIGATTAMFSLLSGVLLRPLPVKDAQRILNITEVNTRTGTDLQVSMTDFLDWKARLRSFSEMALYRGSQGNLTGLGTPERVRILLCDPNMLPALGVAPVRGRNFSADQVQPGNAKQALLSWDYWQSRFGGRDVIGRRIVIDEKPYTIVGVLPNLRMMFGEQNVWLPVEFDLSKLENGRGYHWYQALARLRPGVNPTQSNQELSALAASLAAQHSDWNENVGAHARVLRDTIVGDYSLALKLLFAFVVGVLCIACVNVANLSLARGSSRNREMSIRVALGATRLQLFRQLLTESVLLACSAAVAGIGLAAVLIRAIMHMPFLNIPLSRNVALDSRVVLFSAALAVLTGIGFGLAPAVRASLVSVAEVLKQASARTTESRAQWNLKRFFIVLQSALAALLLVFSGLLLRSLVNASHIELGFEERNLLTMHISLPLSRVDEKHPGKIGSFTRTVLARIRAIPGVESAAISSTLPLTGRGGGAGVLVEGEPQPKSAFSAPYAEWTIISPRYFRTLGVPIVYGRDFDDRDNQTAPSVVIVNQAFVKRFLKDASSKFTRIALASDPSHYRQIVGVVRDVRQSGVETQPLPQIFLPVNQVDDIWFAISARVKGDAAQYFAPIRNAVQSTDPGIAVFLPRTMEEIVHEQRGWRNFETSLVSCFGAVAILLAALGSYAVVSYSIGQRVPEIGIRMALGATHADILKNYTRQGCMPALVGAGIGILAALWLARLAANLLYGIGPNDAVSYCAAAAIIVLAAVLASYVPARRAALLDPSRALRYE